MVFQVTRIPSQSNVLTTTSAPEIANGEEQTITTHTQRRYPTRLATPSQHNPPVDTLNDRQRSRISPHRQSANTMSALRQTDSEGICVTFRPESSTVNENVDDDMDVIPSSPQPQRRRRFKLIPRLYQDTQYPIVNTCNVLQANSDDER